MALPWVRLDCEIGTHDKILALLADPSPRRWQAAFSYTVAMGWSGGQGTDGHIPPPALPFVHGTEATARLLVVYRLWEETTNGWDIHNFATRQELAAITEGKRAAQRVGGAKGNCVRHHGPDCGCWKQTLHTEGKRTR